MEPQEKAEKAALRRPYTEDDLYEDQQIIRDAEDALPGALALLKSVEQRVSDLRYTIAYSRERIRSNTTHNGREVR